jgi:hypothetical protein
VSELTFASGFPAGRALRSCDPTRKQIQKGIPSHHQKNTIGLIIGINLHSDIFDNFRTSEVLDIATIFNIAVIATTQQERRRA